MDTSDRLTLGDIVSYARIETELLKKKNPKQNKSVFSSLSSHLPSCVSIRVSMK